MKYGNFKKIKEKKGFVILFAVTLSAILLSIALGVSNIALKEIKFGTNVRDTNDAFFAADTGIECASYYSKSTEDKFPKGGPAKNGVNCAINNPTYNSSSQIYSFTIVGLGSTGKGCAKVTVNRSAQDTVTITSKGYNIDDNSCNGSYTNRIEREIVVTY